MNNSCLFFSLQIKNTLQCFLASVLRDLKCLPWATTDHTKQFNEKDQTLVESAYHKLRSNNSRAVSFSRQRLHYSPSTLGNKPSLQKSPTWANTKGHPREEQELSHCIEVTSVQHIRAFPKHYCTSRSQCAGSNILPRAKGSLHWSGRQPWSICRWQIYTSLCNRTEHQCKQAKSPYWRQYDPVQVIFTVFFLMISNCSKDNKDDAHCNYAFR